MNPVNWFEIPATDLDRATAFYEAVTGLSLERRPMDGADMAWFPMKGGVQGAGGTIIHGEGYTPSHDGTLIYITVANLEEALEAVAGNGGKALTEIIDIGEFGRIAHFEDTEGNRVALHVSAGENDEVGEAAHADSETA